MQAALHPKVHDLTYPLPKLEMRVHCLHGSGVDTAEHFTYDVPRFSDSAPPAPSHVKQGPGDGTVNLRSLEAGGRYADVSHTHRCVRCRECCVAATFYSSQREHSSYRGSSDQTASMGLINLIMSRSACLAISASLSCRHADMQAGEGGEHEVFPRCQPHGHPAGPAPD